GNGIPDALLADDLALFVPLHEGHAPGGHFLAGGGNTEKTPRQLRFPGPLEGPAPVVAGVIEDIENVVLDVGILVVEHREKLPELAQVVDDFEPEVDVDKIKFRGIKPHQLICLAVEQFDPVLRDRKSTRLNSSHVKISYAVFCLKKK